jgi:hypothetical protein
MFRQASESGLSDEEKQHLDLMLQSLIKMKAARGDAD